jgi:hypothetical protein
MTQQENIKLKEQLVASNEKIQGFEKENTKL